MIFKTEFITEGMIYLFKDGDYYFTTTNKKSLANDFLDAGGEEIDRKEWNEAKSDYKALHGNVKDFSSEL